MGDVRRLVGDIIGILGREVGVSAAGLGGKEKENENEKEKENGGEEEKGGKGLRMISTLDDGIDGALGGGVPTGYVTEFTGERYEGFFFFFSFVVFDFLLNRIDCYLAFGRLKVNQI